MEHITTDSIRYLIEVRENNSREWYSEHKEEYKKLIQEPVTALVEHIGQAITAIDSELYTPEKPSKHISRIYRDTRFSKDKSLYRDVVWIEFMKDKKVYYKPVGYYFEFSPRLIRWGCGSYDILTAVMKEIRESIIADDKEFIAADKAMRENGFRLEGEEYKKDKYPQYSDNKKEWLNKKSFYIVKESTDGKILFDKNLGERLIRDFKALEPVYRYLTRFTKRIDEM